MDRNLQVLSLNAGVLGILMLLTFTSLYMPTYLVVLAIAISVILSMLGFASLRKAYGNNFWEQIFSNINGKAFAFFLGGAIFFGCNFFISSSLAGVTNSENGEYFYKNQNIVTKPWQSISQRQYLIKVQHGQRVFLGHPACFAYLNFLAVVLLRSQGNNTSNKQRQHSPSGRTH
jgi:hypothetical protein